MTSTPIVANTKLERRLTSAQISMIKVTAIVVFILLGLSIILFDWPSNGGAVGFTNLFDHGGFAPMGVTGILLAACMAVCSASVASRTCPCPPRRVSILSVTFRGLRRP